MRGGHYHTGRKMNNLMLGRCKDKGADSSYKTQGQARKPQGQEGGLAPAVLEWHLISGGKPAFLTLRF